MKNTIATTYNHPIQLWASALLMIACLCLMACSADVEKDAAIEVTEDFIITYYVADDVQGSLHHTTGKARKRLESELADITKNANSENSEEKPKVTYKLLKAQKIEDYVYTVNWQVADQYAQKINVTINAVDSDKGWRILDFEENK